MAAGVALINEITISGVSADIETAFDKFFGEVSKALVNDASVETPAFKSTDSI